MFGKKREPNEINLGAELYWRHHKERGQPESPKEPAIQEEDLITRAKRLLL